MDSNRYIGYFIMKNFLYFCSALVLLSGCSGTSDWVRGSDSCTQIGCGEGVVSYPNEQFGAQRQARDWYGFEWGETSSAYSPSDPKHWELKRKEIAAGQTPSHWNQ